MTNLSIHSSAPEVQMANKRRLCHVLTSALRATALMVLPVLYLLATRQLADARGPLWLGSNCDPSYVYLLNSALILNGQVPFHTDHPGTTAQLAGAALLRLAHPQEGTAELNSAILENPERYLDLLILWVNAATAIFMCLCGAVIFKLKSDLVPALIFQVAPFFFNQTYFTSVFFTPELFFPAFSLALATVLYFALDRADRTWPAGICGVIAGACLMLKLTFIPFLPLGLAVFRLRWQPLIYIAFLALAVAVIGFVIRDELMSTWTWIVNLITHSGRYGGGPKEAIAWSTFLPTFVSLLRGDKWYLPLLISGMVFPLLSVIRFGWKSTCADKSNQLLLALTVLELAAFAMVAKHAAAHYLMPLVAMSSLHLLLVLKIFYSLASSRWFQVAFSMALISLGIGSGWKSYEANLHRFKSAAAGQLEGIEKFDEYLEQKRVGDPKVIPVYYYRVSSKAYALYFGHGYTRNFFADNLHQRYPDAWFFNIFNARFYNFKEGLTGAEFYARYPNPVFLGSDSIRNMPFGLTFPLPPNARLNLVWNNDLSLIHNIVYDGVTRE